MTISDVGAQDPDQRNSPIVSEVIEEDQTLRQEVPGDAFCYFNGEAFDNEAVVKSGTMLLRCDRGIWIPTGSSDVV